MCLWSVIRSQILFFLNPHTTSCFTSPLTTLPCYLEVSPQPCTLSVRLIFSPPSKFELLQGNTTFSLLYSQFLITRIQCRQSINLVAIMKMKAQHKLKPRLMTVFTSHRGNCMQKSSEIECRNSHIETVSHFQEKYFRLFKSMLGVTFEHILPLLLTKTTADSERRCT